MYIRRYVYTADIQVATALLSHLVDVLQSKVVESLDVLRHLVVHTLPVASQVILRQSSTHQGS